MRIFVVGATGVLGRALMPLLLQHGHIVRTIACTPEKLRALELAGIETIPGDLLASLLNLPDPPRNPERPCPPSFRCSSEAAYSVLGWKPVHSIYEDVQQVL
jgi:NAD(P)-dependent dehydrogenase (short-subunit alcohol dehydrogenase family)